MKALQVSLRSEPVTTATQSNIYEYEYVRQNNWQFANKNEPYFSDICICVS